MLHDQLSDEPLMQPPCIYIYMPAGIMIARPGDLRAATGSLYTSIYIATFLFRPKQFVSQIQNLALASHVQLH